MNKKTTTSFLHEFYKIFEENNVSASARNIMLAIFSRNGFAAGCCSNKILSKKSGHCFKTIESGCKKLQDKHLASFWIGDNKTRFGKLLLSSDFFQSYEKLFHPSTKNTFDLTKQLFQIKILSKNLTNKVVRGCCFTTNREVEVICPDSDDTFLCIPVESLVEFESITIKNDCDVTILAYPEIQNVFTKGNF